MSAWEKLEARDPDLADAILDCAVYDLEDDEAEGMIYLYKSMSQTELDRVVAEFIEAGPP